MLSPSRSLANGVLAPNSAADVSANGAPGQPRRLRAIGKLHSRNHDWPGPRTIGSETEIIRAAPGSSCKATSDCGLGGVAIDLEQPRLALPTGTTERGNRWAYIDVDETTFFQHPPPACARQATANSIGPKVDVADRLFRHGLTGRDVGELQASARLQHPHDLTEDAALFGAKVDNAVADDDIGPAGLDPQIFDDSLAKLDSAKPHRRRCRARALQHFLGHIDADDLAFGPD